MRSLLLPTVLALTTVLAGCTAGPTSTPSSTPAETAAPSATATPTATPTAEAGRVTTIEVTADGLTLRNRVGVVEELELTDGPEAMLAALTEHLGPATETDVDEEGQCSPPGTNFTRWANAGATLQIPPPDEAPRYPMFLAFEEPTAAPPVKARIPDGPAVGDDAREFFVTVPEWQRGGQAEDSGTMVFDLAPGVEEGAEFNDIVGAAGYVDHEGTLLALRTPSGHNDFYC